MCALGDHKYELYASSAKGVIIELILCVFLCLWSSFLPLSHDGLCLHLSDRTLQCEVAASASSLRLIDCTCGRRARCNCDKRKRSAWLVLGPLSIGSGLIMVFLLPMQIVQPPPSALKTSVLAKCKLCKWWTKWSMYCWSAYNIWTNLYWVYFVFHLFINIFSKGNKDYTGKKTTKKQNNADSICCTSCFTVNLTMLLYPLRGIFIYYSFRKHCPNKCHEHII